MFKILFLSLVCYSFVSTMQAPYLIEDVEGQQYYLTPVLTRQRRDLHFAENKPPFYGGFGGGNKDAQHAVVNFDNGSGFSAAHAHIPGFGHMVKGDVRVPVWSNKNKWGESTLNLGLGGTEYVGRYGNHNLDTRFGLNFNQKF